MNKPVARDWVGSPLHIYLQAGVPELLRWFFIVAVARSLWLKLPFRFKILHPAHKRVFRVVGLGRSGSFRVALGS